MSKTTAVQAVDTAKRMAGNPYWYACSGQQPTEQLLQQLITGQFKAKWTPARIVKARGEAGKFPHCFDCIGLIRFICNMQKNRDALFTNADRLRTISNPQPISTLPENPGALVFMRGHVGIYIGGGRVIEAWGFRQVDDNPLSFQKWTHWGFIPWLDYGAVSQQNSTVTKVSQPAPKHDKTPKQKESFKKGDTVILNGPVFRDSYGAGQGRTFKNHRSTITITAPPNRAAPYHIGNIGWARPGDIKKVQDKK